MHALVWYRDPEKIRGNFKIFHGKWGFIMRVELETGGPLTPSSGTGYPPLPRLPSDDEANNDDDCSFTTAECKAASYKGKSSASSDAHQGSVASG